MLKQSLRVVGAAWRHKQVPPYCVIARNAACVGHLVIGAVERSGRWIENPIALQSFEIGVACLFYESGQQGVASVNAIQRA